ncbi:TNFAIP3-interacting protein 2 isoform X2 [Ornithorhynchus anatinus]|nr:TNFAIP3-interacting protein 2 isoform X2 [Ornithorhynchus anatinus]
MQKIITRPQHEREREILLLQRSLAEKEKVQATSEVLCRSLTDETHQLRRTLAATAEMCQHLARCLEEKQSARGKSEDGIPLERPDKLQFSDSEMPLQEAVICKLQEENTLLKQKVIYVEDLNAKWQKYDASRDEYVKGLHSQLKAAREQAGQGAAASGQLMRKEIFRLNKLLEEKLNDCGQVERELEDLRKARDGDKERMQILEEQVLVYRDDFTSERADRERAQSKIQELQEQVAALQQQLSGRQEGREGSGHCRIHVSNKSHMYVGASVAEPLLGAGAEQGGSRRAQPRPEQSASQADAPGSARRDQGDLQCPYCMRLFDDEQGEEVMRHMMECCQ